MDLPDKRDIPIAEIPRLCVAEEVVGHHKIRPAVCFHSFPPIPFAVHGKSAYQEFLHGASIHLLHHVQLHVEFQKPLHGVGL